MTPCLEFLIALLAAFGLVCLIWLMVGRLLLPVICPTRVVVTASGAGDGLEQTVRGLLWLRGSGLWRGALVIEDGGLDQEGLALAQMLAQRDGVELDSARHREPE